MLKCCADEGCEKTKIIARGLCDCHYRMWRVYGRTTRVTRKHGEGSITSDGYHVTTVPGRGHYSKIELSDLVQERGTVKTR